MTSFSIPSSVTKIGKDVFSFCSNLKTIIIPSSVVSIGTLAFASCSLLSSIYVYSSTPISLTTSSSVFYGVNKSTCILYVPIGCQNVYRTAYQWKEFNNVEEFSTTNLDLFNTNKVIIYPNPVTNGFHINGITGLSMLRLSDINGKVLLSKEVNNNEYISVSSLSRGMYLVKVTSQGRDIEQKIIKN